VAARRARIQDANGSLTASATGSGSRYSGLSLKTRIPGHSQADAAGGGPRAGPGPPGRGPPAGIIQSESLPVARSRSDVTQTGTQAAAGTARVTPVTVIAGVTASGPGPGWLSLRLPVPVRLRP